MIKDFGVDGTFRQTTATGKRRFTSGYALDFQLKASTNCFLEPGCIAYDLEAKNYNDLVHRRVSSDATACILILKVLPSDSSQWLTTGSKGLSMGGACYWEYIDGEISKNKKSVRIRISNKQEFNLESLLRLMTCAREYSISGDWIC